MTEEEIVGAENWLQESLLAQELLKLSRIDEKTLKAMLFYHLAEGTTFQEIAKKLRIQQPGAWKRWKRGEDSILRSFYTLELAVYAGILDTRVAQFMADDLTDYANLAKGSGDVDAIRDRIERRMVQVSRELRRRRRPSR
jgi:DNA-binding Lrp family transcriptional regulator